MDARDKIQSRAAKKLKLSHEEGNHRGLLVMAPGLGKTRVAVEDVKAYLQGLKECTKEHAESNRVLFICHMDNLLTQARKEFEYFFSEEYSMGYYCVSLEKCDKPVDFLFATFQTMVKDMNKFKPDEFDYIVVDEAHHAKADGWEKVMKYFKPDFLLGLTATPDRMDQRDIREIFGLPTYEIDLATAIREGYLSNVVYRLMMDDIESIFDLIKKKDAETQMTLGELNRKVFAPKRDEEIVRLIRKNMKKDGKTMIFCNSIEHAERIKRLMPEAGIIHSEINKHINMENIDAFRRGDIKTIISVDMLNEGIDVPDVDLVAILRKSGSRAVIEQQIGRGLRPLKDKDHVLVLDFVANCERLLEIASLKARISGGGTTATNDDERFVIDIPAMIKFNVQAVDIIEYLERARDFDKFRSWTQAEAIEALQRLRDELGHVPTKREVDASEYYPSAKTLRSLFGSYNAALVAAGMKPNQTKWTREEAIRALRRRRDELGHAPTKREAKASGYCPSDGILKKLFGSFNEALVAAGMEPNQTKRRWTKEEAIKALQKCRDELGHTPTYKEMRKSRYCPSDGIMQSLFGSYNAALIAAGMEPNLKLRKWSRDKVIKALQKRRDELGHTPTHKEIAESEYCPSYPSLKIFFDSYDEALIAAGIEPNWTKKWTQDEVIEALRRLRDELGHTPTYKEARESEYCPSYGVLKRLFGSYGGALIVAGMKPNQIRGWTQDKSIEVLRKLRDKLGRTPMGKEVDESEYCLSCDTLRKLFGSYNKALIAAGMEPNRHRSAK